LYAVEAMEKKKFVVFEIDWELSLFSDAKYSGSFSS